jgi:hypothetical protein
MYLIASELLPKSIINGNIIIHEKARIYKFLIVRAYNLLDKLAISRTIEDRGD